MTDRPTALTRLPRRLHHNAWVVSDQERTHAFYEGVLGMPLTAFWIERDDFRGHEIVMSHAFYGLEDGSALAFFNFADPKLQERFKSPSTEVFNHVALVVDEETQQRFRSRLGAAQIPTFDIDHGYCRSLYVTDPDGLRLELTVDSPQVDQINAEQLRTAHASLASWMGGARNSNNHWRRA